MKRFFCLVLLCGAATLAGCKEPPQAADSKVASGFIRAGQDVTIKDVRTYATSDAVAGSNDEYYIITFGFTNNLGYSLKPQIDHFVIEDLQKRRYLGVDSGNAVLVGISNYGGVLAKGDAHEYTVGFRVSQGTQGTLFYDATF